MIDISDAQLDDQLIELEKLTTIESTATNGATANNTKAISNTSTDSDNLVELTDSSVEHDKLFSDLLSPSLSLDSNLNDLLGAHETNNFDADWTSMFGNNTSNQQVPASTNPANVAQANSTFLPSSLLSELLTSNNKTSTSNIPSSTNPKAKPTMTDKSAADKSNWLDLFAELDPLQDPDAIGKSAGAEANRNC